MKNASVFSVKKKVHLLGLRTKILSLKFWWKWENSRGAGRIPGSPETKMKLERGLTAETCSSWAGTEKGECQIAWGEVPLGIFDKRTVGPGSMGIDKGRTEEINIKSQVFLKGSKEKNGLTRGLQNSLMSKWESCGQWYLGNKYFKYFRGWWHCPGSGYLKWSGGEV